MRVGLAVFILCGLAFPVAIPIGSACYSSDPILNYVVCSSEKYEDVNEAVEFAEESVQGVLDPVYDHCKTTIQDLSEEAPPAPEPAPTFPTPGEFCDDSQGSVNASVAEGQEALASTVGAVTGLAPDPPIGAPPGPSPSPSPPEEPPQPEPQPPEPGPSPTPEPTPPEPDDPPEVVPETPPDPPLPSTPRLPEIWLKAQRRSAGPAAEPSEEPEVMEPGISAVKVDAVTRPDPPSAPTEIVTVLIISSGGLFWLYQLILYNRLTGDRVESNPVRRRLLEHIRGQPASTIPALAEALAIHPTTVAYHLRVLERYGHVVVHGTATNRWYFENHGRYGPGARRVWAALQRPAYRDFLQAVHETAGHRLADVARRLGVSISTAGYRAGVLERADVLIRQGRTWRLTETALEVLRAPAPPGLAGQRSQVVIPAIPSRFGHGVVAPRMAESARTPGLA